MSFSFRLLCEKLSRATGLQGTGSLGSSREASAARRLRGTALFVRFRLDEHIRIYHHHIESETSESASERHTKR